MGSKHLVTNWRKLVRNRFRIRTNPRRELLEPLYIFSGAIERGIKVDSGLHLGKSGGSAAFLFECLSETPVCYRHRRLKALGWLA